MKVYRIEKDKENGVWYNKKSEFCVVDEGLMHLPMPAENEVYKGIYRSSCPTVEDLLYWIPKDVQQRLKQRGYKLVEYETHDYFERPHNEICFNKTNFEYRKEIGWGQSEGR